MPATIEHPDAFDHAEIVWVGATDTSVEDGRSTAEGILYVLQLFSKTIPEDSIVLDPCCGNGFPLAGLSLLLEQDQVRKLVGCDILANARNKMESAYQKQWQRALQETASDRLEYVFGNCTQLGLPDGPEDQPIPPHSVGLLITLRTFDHFLLKKEKSALTLESFIALVDRTMMIGGIAYFSEDEPYYPYGGLPSRKPFDSYMQDIGFERVNTPGFSNLVYVRTGYPPVGDEPLS